MIYLIITEDGRCYQSKTISTEDLQEGFNGVLDILRVLDDSHIQRLTKEGWEAPEDWSLISGGG